MNTNKLTKPKTLTMNQKQYNDMINRFKQSKYFENEIECNALFGKSKYTPPETRSNKSYAMTLSALLKRIGFKITRKQVREKGTIKSSYVLTWDKELYEFVKKINAKDEYVFDDYN